MDRCSVPCKQGTFNCSPTLSLHFLKYVQIVLGVAAYGHSFHVNTSAALDSSNNLVPYPPFDKALQPLGDSDEVGASPSEFFRTPVLSRLSHPISNPGVDQCGNPTGVGGTFNFVGMMAAGFLDSTGKAADGMEYRYDDCSQTVGISF